MQNRHYVEYHFERVEGNTFRFVMDEEEMKYMTIGGLEGQDGLNLNSVGSIDPPGGPYLSVGGQIYPEEVTEKISEPLTITKIDCSQKDILLEVK